MSRFMVVIFCSLVAAIATEGTSGRLLNQSDRSIRSSRVAQSAATAAASAKMRDSQWLETTLTRPLFSPDRKPLPGVTVADPALPRLSGIIMAAQGPLGIFQADESGKRTIVHSGDSIAGWRVAGIEREAIHLEKHGERVIVTPNFASPSSPGMQPVQARR